jgi:hypothetical protein
LEDKRPADWDDGALPYLEAFLRVLVPYRVDQEVVRRRTMKDIVHMPLSQLFKSTSAQQEIAHALKRRGKPRCTEKDFQELVHLLGCAGYGWLRAEGVRSKLKQIQKKGLRL